MSGVNKEDAKRAGTECAMSGQIHMGGVHDRVYRFLKGEVRIQMQARKRKEKQHFWRKKDRPWGKAFLAIGWLLCAGFLFCGCGKHACAICGAEAERNVSVGGKEIGICGECYKNYIEIQELFDEEL